AVLAGRPAPRPPPPVREPVRSDRSRPGPPRLSRPRASRLLCPGPAQYERSWHLPADPHPPGTGPDRNLGDHRPPRPPSRLTRPPRTPPRPPPRLTGRPLSSARRPPARPAER